MKGARGASARRGVSRAAVGLALALAGCAPVVTHGPRVESGGSLHVTAGVPAGRCDSGCAALLAPTLGATLRGGYAPANPRVPAVMAGLTVPLLSPRSPEVDLYVQGPGRDAALSYGAGALASRRHLVPYAQLGRTPPRRVGWYATLGYARLLRFEEFILERDEAFRPVPSLVRAPRYWQPQVAVRFPTRAGSTDLYVAGLLGDYLAEPANAPERRHVRMAVAGASIALDPRDAPRSGRAPRFPRLPPFR